HAWQSERAHRKIVVDRKNLDEDWPLRREAIFRRERLDRLLRERHRVLAQHRSLVRVELQDDVPFLELDELVELVEERQQVPGDLVVRIDLKRPVERL